MSDGLKNSPLPDEDSLPAESLSTPADEPAGGGTALPFSAAAQTRTPAGSTAGATAPAAPAAAGVASGTAASGAPSTGTADPAGAVRDRAGLVPLTPGTRVHGTITGIVDYGAFLVTDDGRRGLIHISEIADWYVERAEDYFYKGERVQVEVVHFDPNSGKYAFSTRRLGGKQPLANRYADRLLELHRYCAGSTRPGSGSGWNRRYRPGRTGRPAAGPAGTWRSAGGAGRPPGTGAAGPSPSGPAEASAAGRGLAGARETGSGHPRPGLPGSRFHRPGAGPASRFTGPGTGRMGSTGLGRTSPHPAVGETAGDTGLPAGRAGAQPLTGPAVVREGDPDLRDSAYGVVEGGLHSGREAREALLQLLRHHVGQVSPAARSELDRLVETYGTERVATALARVLEETDRALQVVEAAGRQLAGG